MKTMTAKVMTWPEPVKRINVGCGEYPLAHWINIDADRKLRMVDVHATVPPLPYENASLDEIYAGHFLEHLTPEDAHLFMDECFRCLKSGGTLGLVVPDTREVMRRYVHGTIDEIEYPVGVFRKVADLNTICEMFLYSTVQESHHQWSYDSDTLQALMKGHGFLVTREINRFHDPRIPVGAWYQFGFDAVKP